MQILAKKSKEIEKNIGKMSPPLRIVLSDTGRGCALPHAQANLITKEITTMLCRFTIDDNSQLATLLKKYNGHARSGVIIFALEQYFSCSTRTAEQTSLVEKNQNAEGR